MLHEPSNAQIDARNAAYATALNAAWNARANAYAALEVAYTALDDADAALDAALDHAGIGAA